MATKAIQPETVSSKLIDRWEQVGQKLLTLAEEIPENKFEYRPVEGVRSPAEVLRHVAFWNQYVGDRARGKNGDDAANELPKDKFSTKKQILNALKRSTAEALTGLKEHESALTPDMAEMLTTFIEHNCEHYGQLVVYARTNGIVPPASRR
jgi:uncharacterized damage-inducible protein DinB